MTSTRQPGKSCRPGFADKSGIGVHYLDAFLKPMNTKLPDGTRVGCKRKGLKVMLTVGTKKGEGLMRRLDVSKDPVVMLNAALQEAARAAGVELKTRRTKSCWRIELPGYLAAHLEYPFFVRSRGNEDQIVFGNTD